MDDTEEREMNEELEIKRISLYDELEEARRHFVNDAHMLNVIARILYGDPGVFDAALAYLRAQIEVDKKEAE